MRKALVLLLGVSFIALLIGSVAARDVVDPGKRAYRDEGRELLQFSDPGLRGFYESSEADTYCIVWYTFETSNWMGWTREDNTAQVDTFFHVDNFVGLGGGDFGLLVPIEGAKSMWCGVRPNPNDPYLCSWRNAPGYGNNWNQMLQTDPITFVGAIRFAYHIVYDSEPDYDYTRVYVDAGGENWQLLSEYTADGEEVIEHFIPLTTARTKLRFHFTADGAWSDQDGLWNTDGGCIVDSLVIRDAATYYNYQNFEAAPVNALRAGIWYAKPEDPYGKYSGLRSNLTDKDPCGVNFGTQVVFFVGSTEPSSEYPGLYNTPKCKGPGNISAPCQAEQIVSPIIDMTKYSTVPNNVQNADIPAGDLPQLGGTILRFTVYRDLPLANLVFYVWSVRQIVEGCPGQWQDDNYVYYGPDKDYIYGGFNVSKYIGTNNPVQIAVGIQDMCDAWYNTYGNCANHTPSPWIDNVRLYRFKTSGPQWGYRDLDFFQDNFPSEEYVIESIVRADAANDILPGSNPNIRPGDSIVVDCQSQLGGGIAPDPAGGPAVYLHVRAKYIGPPPLKPDLYGPGLAGSVQTAAGPPPVVVNFRYVSDNGEWTVIQCDSARTTAGVVLGKYMVDLNDELFTRGYKIEYYFTAVDNASIESAFPRWARSQGPYFEFTCLPTLNSDVLFVDDFEGRGSWNGTVEDFWMPVFDAVLAPPNSNVDKYDVNAPSSAVSNGPGSRAKTYHLTSTYNKVVWDSGDLESGTLSEGITDKSNDCQMLIDWMSQSEHRTGLWVCGDDIAYELSNSSSASAIALLGQYCGVRLVETSYFELTGGRTGGGVVTPLITGDADAGLFIHGGVPDRFYAFGGCPIINEFDVLEKNVAGAKYALRYPDYLGAQYYAGIANATKNASEYDIRTVWFGFSYMYVRDDVMGAPIDRFEIARDVFNWFMNDINENITDAKTPTAYALAQNFPNPFNPATTIKFDMREKGYVTLKIYNVAGQLVRTLVDGVKDAGSYSVTWDGLSDRGSAVASGVYFYKMETKDFSQTKKMVMLR